MNPSTTALITGGARGIGLAVAEELLSCGWAVALLDVNAAGLAHAEQHLTRRFEPHRVLTLTADVGDAEQVAAAADQAVAHFGRLDGLVNNAGIAGGMRFRDLTLEAWRRVIDVNLTAAFVLAQRCAEALARDPGGAIVHIASTRALMSEPDSEPYAASKAGLLGLTHALAMSLGPAVRVNAVCPGWIDTRADVNPDAPAPKPYAPPHHQQHPAGRIGTPVDVARIVRFLLSSDSGFITATQVVVDGGMTRKMIYLGD